MLKQTKNILIATAVISAVLAGGVLAYSNFIKEPVKQAQATIQPIVDENELQMDEQVKKAGRNYSEVGNNDGTITRTYTLSNSQYLADDNTYQPIDTAIVESAGDFDYENTTNVFKTYFNKNAQAETVMKFQIGSRSVGVSFVGANRSEAVVEGNSITYPDLYSGLDAKYTITSKTFSEELIAKEEFDIDVISQKIKLDGVYYKQQPDGSITFHDEDTKKIVWQLIRPSMHEKEYPQNRNFDLHYEIIISEEGYVLNKVIDQEGKSWLEQANYPVIIDPTYIVDYLAPATPSQGTMWKAYLGATGTDYYHAETEHSNFDFEGEVGRENCDNGHPASFYSCSPQRDNWFSRAFLSFDTSSLPEDAYDVSASLKLTLIEKINSPIFSMGVYAGADLWTEFADMSDIEDWAMGSQRYPADSQYTLQQWWDLYSSMAYSNYFVTSTWSEGVERGLSINESNISWDGFTQFVLRGGGVADRYVRVGVTPDGSDPPRLEVTYTVPFYSAYSTMVSAYTLTQPVVQPPQLDSIDNYEIRVTDVPSSWPGISDGFALGVYADDDGWRSPGDDTLYANVGTYDGFWHAAEMRLPNGVAGDFDKVTGSNPDALDGSSWDTYISSPSHLIIVWDYLGGSLVPNRPYEVGFYNRNSDGVLTPPTAAGKVTVYARASPAHTPDIIPTSGVPTSLDVVMDRQSDSPNYTDFAMQEANSGNYITVSGTTGQLIGAAAQWYDYDASAGGSPHWSGATGIELQGLEVNTCYSFWAKPRNEDNQEGEEPGDCDSGPWLFACEPGASPNQCPGTCVAADPYPWSSATGNICTEAAVPGTPTVSCNYTLEGTTLTGYSVSKADSDDLLFGIQEANAAEIDPAIFIPADTYYCTVDIDSGGNPANTEYFIEYRTCEWDGVTDCSDWFNARETWSTNMKFVHYNPPTGLECSVNQTTYKYQVKARNQSVPPIVTDPSPPGSDTLPPCEPENMGHSDNPFDDGEGEFSIYWSWAVPDGGEGVKYYNLYDMDGNCLAGDDGDGFCDLTELGGEPIKSGTAYNQYYDAGPDPLKPNLLYYAYVRAIDGERAGRPSSVHPAYTAIQPPAGISFGNFEPTSITVKADGELTNIGILDAGVQFQETSPNNGGGGQLGFSPGWRTDHEQFVIDEELDVNTEYCYQVRSRNSEGSLEGNGDIQPPPNNWIPGSPACKYTRANVPRAPKISRIDADNINVIIRSDDENPHGGTETDTEYAICVSQIDTDDNEVAESYVDASGQVDFTNGDPDYCSTPAGEATATWQPRGDDAAGWGANSGIDVNLDTTSKYEFKVRARNGNDIVTDFGPSAVLFLVKNNIVGWAWSSNTGWLSMNCLNHWANPIPYGYSCDSARNWGWNTYFESGREINPLEGYAWSGSGQAIGHQWMGADKRSTAIPARTNDYLSADKNIAIDSAGHPHIVWSQGSPMNVFYQKWDGNQWVDANNISNSAVTSYKPSLVLDRNDNPHVSWTERFGGDDNRIYYLRWDPDAGASGAWVDVDGSDQTAIQVSGPPAGPGSIGSGDSQYPSLQVDESGYPHLAWEDIIEVGSDPVAYSQWNGSDWVKADGSNPGFDSFSTDFPSLGPNPSLAIESSTGFPHVVWKYDVNNIYYKYWDEPDSNWLNRGGSDEISGTTETVGSPSIVLGSDNSPHIAWGAAVPDLYAYYQKWDSTDARWETVDGLVVDLNRENCQAIFGEGRWSTSLQLDSQNYPHIVAYGDWGPPRNIKYRYWNPYVNSGAGAWVTASNDFNAFGSDPNLVVTSDANVVNAASLALDHQSNPHIIWHQGVGGSEEVYYNYWGESMVNAGIGWVSPFVKVCDNNSQQGCFEDADCSNGGVCTVLADEPPSGGSYGYCYTQTGALGTKYGYCSQTTSTPCVDDIPCVLTDEYCVYYTCQTDQTCQVDTPPETPTGNEQCRVFTTANFSGSTREIEGWARILSQKEYGEDQGFSDWGWLKLKGEYDDGQGTSGSYGLTGVEVDSQGFLSDPDVNPNDVQLYSVFGWSWQGETADYASSSSWLPPVNVSQTKEAIAHPMVIDSEGNPHLAWLDVEGYYCENDPSISCISDAQCGSFCKANQDIYYLKWSNEAGDWVDIDYAVDGQPRDDIRIANSRLQTAGQNCLLTENLNLAVDSSDNPHFLWKEGSCGVGNWAYAGFYHQYWNGSSWQEHANQQSNPCPAGTDSPGYFNPVCSGAGDAFYVEMVLDKGDYPHITWSYGSIWDETKIAYRYWEPTADSGNGGWVTVTGDFGTADLDVDDTPTRSERPVLALSNEDPAQPHIAWHEQDGSTKGNVYFRKWDPDAGASGEWVTASGDFGSAASDPNLDVSQIYTATYNGGRYPVIVLDTNNNAQIAYTAYHETDGRNYLYFRRWEGAWVTIFGDGATGGHDGTNLKVDSNSEPFSDYAPSIAMLSDDNPRIAWADYSSEEIFYRWWDDSDWVTVSGQTDNTNRNASNTADDSRNPSLVLDAYGNPYLAWWERKIDGSSTCSESHDANCAGTDYPYCRDDWPFDQCNQSDIMYTRWGPGVVQSGLGWFEFMPAGILLGVPWLQTQYSDIYAGGTIELAPPPRGSGEYTATYLILADGSIVGIPGFYSQTQTGRPTSGFVVEGFDPLIEQFGQPLGTDVLSRINTTVLTTDVGSGLNKYGHAIDGPHAGGDLATIIGQNPVLNGAVYHIQEDATIDSQMTFMIGDASADMAGSGLIIIEGDLGINANLIYQEGPLNYVSELPSVAFIVQGDIYVNSLVSEISGVFVAKGASTTDGYIYTSRQKGTELDVAASVDDTYVSYSAPAGPYNNNIIATNLRFGYEASGATRDRTFLRWPINVPEGAEIRKAYIRLTADGNSQGGDFNAKIYLIDESNISDFNSFASDEIIYKLPTLTSEIYDTSGWSDNGGDLNETVDISALVQRYIDRDDYTPSNHMGIVIKEGNASTAGGGLDTYKQFYARDDGSGNEPQLVIEYSSRRVGYNLAGDSDDGTASAGDWNSVIGCNYYGWGGAEGAKRTYLRFTGINIPPNAQILESHVKARACAGGDAGDFQMRQGLLEGYPDFSGNPFDALMDGEVSEIAYNLASDQWLAAEEITFPDISSLIEKFITRGDYSPGTPNSSELGIRIRRGNDTVENAGPTDGDSFEYRKIDNYENGINSYVNQLEVDYRAALKVNGLLVARGYSFDRKYTKGLEASELIVYDGRVVANTPPGLSDFTAALPIYQKVIP